MYVKASTSQFITRERVGSIVSDSSSPGPQTPYDDSGSSLPPLSAASKNAWHSNRAERTPVVTSAPIQRCGIHPIIESRAVVSQPVTPINRHPTHKASHSVDWRLQASSTRLPLHHHPHSYSVSNDPSDPSPLAGLIDEEYSHSLTSAVPVPESVADSAPTLRHALLVQQEKYRTLKNQLRESENAKEERDRQIALLQKEANKRAEELKGLKLLLAEVEMSRQSNQPPSPSERGSPLTRSASMPFLSIPTHDVDVPSSARPGDTFDHHQDGSCSRSGGNPGLGIDMEAGDRVKSKRYGKAMMRPPPPPMPRGKLPTPSFCSRSKSKSSKRSKDLTSVPTSAAPIVTQAVPVAPLNIIRKKDTQKQARIDPLVGMDMLSKELKELKSSNGLQQ